MHKEEKEYRDNIEKPKDKKAGDTDKDNKEIPSIH